MGSAAAAVPAKRCRRPSSEAIRVRYQFKMLVVGHDAVVQFIRKLLAPATRAVAIVPTLTFPLTIGHTLMPPAPAIVTARTRTTAAAIAVHALRTHHTFLRSTRFFSTPSSTTLVIAIHLFSTSLYIKSIFQFIFHYYKLAVCC